MTCYAWLDLESVGTLNCAVINEKEFKLNFVS